ncbi:uncharacterized protein isoform X2 [Choristoneura fumiferana]|uniref:uncharacterized protein isoform X2 n=1 Tax=Choristoneura fumiferana TaxID=7141 RepID=UPI003D15DAFA
MMLTILGLPLTTKYKDLKVLIKTRCSLNDFILDDLVGDNNGLKKVRIGLADANEGAHLMKCLDGYRLAGGYVLSVTPVGKTPMPGPGPQQNQNFNQPHTDYRGNDYNDSRPSPWGQQQPQPNQWAPNPMGQGPQNNFGYQGQGPSMQNQYIPPQQQHQNQMPHHNQPQNLHPNHQGHLPNHQNMHSGPPQMQRPDLKPFPQRDQFQGNRGPQDQGYGFQAKNNMPEPPQQRSHVLRTVEIVDTPINRPLVQPNRYPGQDYPPQNKPMTIMKDNFQGPSEYNLGQGPAPQAGQPWMQQQQQQKPPAFTDPKRPPIKPQGSDSFKDYDKDFEPLSPDRHMRESPFRKASPGRGSPRRYSPGRRSPPRRSPGRRMSPGRRSPGRRGSPGPRPLEHERRSPGRMGPGMDGPGRSWSGRRPSPGKRSPNRRPDPASLRYSPSRRLADKPDEFLDRAGGKSVRPAYEPPSQAANQAMYPGGYRPNAHEKVKYPIQGQRPVETRDSPWQQERDKAMFNEVLKKREEERSARMPFERPGLRLDKDQRSHSPRKSRSPLRRDTSPSRDRYKRHSPSPRSPRRSWALEKRRSPDLGEAPPPPIWPGQASRDEKRPDFADVETKRKPVWDYKKDISDTRRPEDDRRFPAPEGIRVRRDLGPIVPPEHREELEFKPHDRFPRDGPKFSPRDDFDKKVPKFNPRDDFDKKVGPKFSPRDDFEKKGPKFSPRDDFEKKGPKFSPRDDFEKKGPKFSPRDDFDKKGPKFSPRDDFDKRPKFSPRDDFIKVPKFSPRDDYQEPKVSRDDLMRKDPKFGHDIDRPKFSPRDDYEDRRDDIRKHDLSDWKPREIPLKPPERDVYRGDFPKRDEPSRIELRRDVLRKMSEELDKQFEDVHKRAQDFHKRAEEYRRDDRKREYERGPPQPKPFEDRHHDEDRRDFRIEERRKEDWNTDEHLKNKAIIIAAIKAKKEKATQEISQKILDKHNIDAEAPQNSRICEELRVSVGKLINEMFGDNDVSFIELVIKFNAKYSGAGEDKILRDVMASFPSQFRPKRSAPEYAEVPAKRSRRTPEPDLNKDANIINTQHGRRAYSPGPRQRPVKPDGYREWKPIPSPAKKPRVETHPYQEPERRPMVKPAYKMAPEPRATNAAVIEKKPVLFNPSQASVSNYPPLPQRNPVQKQPPKQVPQKPEPAKTVPRKPEPVKTVPQKIETAKTIPPKAEHSKAVPQKVEPAKIVPQKVQTAKTVPQNVVQTEKTVPQKVVQAKTVPQKVEPVKSAQKPTVAQKQEAKPAQKPEAQIEKPKSAADKDIKPVESKEPETTPSVEPNPDGYYQLDSPTSHVLEDELHQIMAKVSQALPKEPSSDAERLVLGKLNGVAGDDIKNALGMNVTKRLLNQNNPLYVKLVFSGKPEAGRLQAFIAAHRISAFKRIASPGDTFAARLDAAQDFDRLCETKELTCGSARVTVTPCYKFLTCPPTVKTIYEVSKEEAKEKPDSNNSSPQKQHNVEKSDNSEAKTADPNNKISPEDDTKKGVNETETKDVNQTEETKAEIPDKNKKVAASPVTVNITIEAHSKSDEVKNASKETPKVEAKKETAKSEVNNQNNEPNKAKSVNDRIEEIMVVDEHIDDGEKEMTDHDILALMSGGIVLDECSGSDDE